MCKIDLRLLALISFIPVGLHAAESVIVGLKTVGEVIDAAEPIVKVVGPALERGAEVVGAGVGKGLHKKIKERVAALEANCVLKEDFDASQKAQEDEIGRLRAKIPSQNHPHGFVLSDPNDPVVIASGLKAATAPIQADIQGLQASMSSHVTQQQLNDATADVMKRQDVKDLVAGEMQAVVKDDPKNQVVRQNEINDVVRQNDMRNYITKDELEDVAKNAAGQFALGFSSYRLSCMIQSLLESAGMKNQYVDLKDISVPMTTFMTSFAARCAKEIYNDRPIEPQVIAQKSLIDTAASAIVIALKNIFFDEQMHAHWNERSENLQAGAYAVAVVPVSLVMNSFVQRYKDL